MICPCANKTHEVLFELFAICLRSLWATSQITPVRFCVWPYGQPSTQIRSPCAKGGGVCVHSAGGTFSQFTATHSLSNAVILPCLNIFHSRLLELQRGLQFLLPRPCSCCWDPNESHWQTPQATMGYCHSHMLGHILEITAIYSEGLLDHSLVQKCFDTHLQLVAFNFSSESGHMSSWGTLPGKQSKTLEVMICPCYQKGWLRVDSSSTGAETRRTPSSVCSSMSTSAWLFSGGKQFNPLIGAKARRRSCKNSKQLKQWPLTPISFLRVIMDLRSTQSFYANVLSESYLLWKITSRPSLL